MPKTSTVNYSDFNITMQPNPMSGDILRVFGVNSVVQAVQDLVLTNHFERPFHPEIGGNITKLLFSLPTPATAQLLSEEIKDVIANFEPRVSVLECLVNAGMQGTLTGYNVTLVFQITGISQPLQIQLFLSRLR